MSLYTIDRVEGDWVVLEDEGARTFQVPKSWLPESFREGDVARVQKHPNSTPTQIVLDVSFAPEERAQRRQSADKERGGIPQGPKGDFSL